MSNDCFTGGISDVLNSTKEVRDGRFQDLLIGEIF